MQKRLPAMGSAGSVCHSLREDGKRDSPLALHVAAAALFLPTPRPHTPPPAVPLSLWSGQLRV